MGITWSKRHRRHHHQPLPPSSSSPEPPSPTTTNLSPPPPPPPLPPPRSSSPFSSITPTPPPPPTTRPAQSTQSPSYAFAANAPHPTFPPAQEQHPYPAYPPPPPPPPPLPPFSYNNYSYNFSNYYPRPTGQHSNYRPYYIPQINGWGQSPAHLPRPAPPLHPPAPYVDHQNAKKIKNDVNVHKDTIRLQLDVQNEDCHLVTFTFDALVDGSITIFYFAKEGPNCSFTPVYPEIKPVKIPFQKGLGQNFCQTSGTGVDLGFFDTDDLSKPFPGDDVYPLVILAESCGSILPEDEHSNLELISASRHAQISQAVLEKKNDGNFQVKVMKQILWIDGVRYELREIFGISNSVGTTINDMDLGKECVICMTEVKNTAVLPCRHLCMCSECAKELRLQSDKCPICRQPIEELLEIKVDEEVGA
ncbi:putative E3 ubiquitin-protein ligase LUL4 [Primulina tabacum]|uniref:putative E3 ubiquitin-protein ligase LUL4 n=1 Tax=Primulina tabacum TaxID=48773 RepID=UPI003F5AD3EC